MLDDKRMRVLYVARGRSRAEALSPHDELQSLLGRQFDQNGAEPWHWIRVTNQKAALRVAHTETPRLVFIEIDVTNDRTPFCKALRHRLPAARLISVGSHSPADVAPCDAFLQLPFHSAEVRALLTRLLDGYKGHQFQQGPIHLDLDTRSVVTPKGQYHMTPKQAQLLHYFLINYNQVLSRREIMQQVWDTNFLEDTRTLDVHIRWLRERIELDPSEPQYLVTVRGRGYRLSLETV